MITHANLLVAVFLSFKPLIITGTVTAKAGASTFCTKTQLAKASTQS